MKRAEIQKQSQTILTIWPMVGFYMELTHHWHFKTFQLTPTYKHQRPRSVGMPRHALRRRMANTFYDVPTFPRWLGRYSPRSSRPRETGPADRPSNAKIYTLNSTIINTISKMNRRIVLKFCIRIEEKILRTFSCWHFSEKNVLHGFFGFFWFFSHLSHLWLINHRIKGHFQHEWMPVAAKCTFTKIINGQRSFERSKKFSPGGHPKCRKVPKYFFGLNHFDEIVDLSSRNGPHGLGP